MAQHRVSLISRVRADDKDLLDKVFAEEVCRMHKELANISWHTRHKGYTLSELCLLRVELQIIKGSDNGALVVFDFGQEVGLGDIKGEEFLINGINNGRDQRPNEGCRGFHSLDVFFTEIGKFSDIREAVEHLLWVVESFLCVSLLLYSYCYTDTLKQ